MAYTGTSGGGHATRNIVIALVVAGVAAILIAAFAFGAFNYGGSGGGIYGGGGGGAPQGGGGGADSGGGSGGVLPYAPLNWHLGYDLLTFV